MLAIYILIGIGVAIVLCLSGIAVWIAYDLRRDCIGRAVKDALTAAGDMLR